ncbi:tRNA-Phe hydroxylase [Aureococcus anophagefferens]|nr:tRNA-Phe hydroxylase [Aureococcus anophagefferens]
MARRRGPESSGGAGCYYVVVLGLLVSGFLIGYLNTGSYEAPAGGGAPAGSPARNLRKGASQKHDPSARSRSLEEAAQRAAGPEHVGQDPRGRARGRGRRLQRRAARRLPDEVGHQGHRRQLEPDDMVAPDQMYQSVCRFDYATELAQAIRYRDAEVPFQLYNVPAMNEIAQVNHGANHFMYTNGRAAKNPPIKNVKLSWDDWLGKVEAAKNKSILEPDSRFYFRFSATSASDAGSGWLFKELTFFQPKPNIFFKEPKQQRGIHCRFGMTGVIAEAHWDGSRNMVGQFYGRRRYVLVDPDDSCDMYLLAKNHPSGRHSEVDWSNPDSWDKFPRFPTMKAHEVVQRPGDFLYLPTYYLHYIISIDTNYQCNTRSGKDDRQAQVVNQCTPGFTKEKRDKKKPKRKE